MTPTFELHGIGYSPWTEKARWALRHHRLPHRYREHTIWLGMPALSAKAGLPGSEITVPLLLETGATQAAPPVMDSLEIARFAEKWAENQAGFAALFPSGLLPEIKHYNLLSETLISRFRLSLCHSVMESTEAQDAMAPSFVPGILRPLARPLVKQATRYIMDEFELHKKRPRDLDMLILQALVGLRSALEKAGGQYLLGNQFTYADVTTAVALGGLRPYAPVWEKLTPIQQKIFTDPKLAAQFPELLEWRDRIYSLHNPKYASERS